MPGEAGSPSHWIGRGRKDLLEAQEGWEALPECWEGLGGPPEGLEGVGRPYNRTWRGQKVLPEGR